MHRKQNTFTKSWLDKLKEVNIPNYNVWKTEWRRDILGEEDRQREEDRNVPKKLIKIEYMRYAGK